MKKINLIIVGLLITALFGVSMAKPPANTKHDDYVPDKATAIKITEAIWLPIYGKSVLEEKPYKAKLIKNSIWVVVGSPPKLKPNEDFVGGVAYIEIRKSDCKILYVIHGK